MPVTAQDLDQEATFISGIDATGAVAKTTYWTWNTSDTSAVTYNGANSGINRWQGGTAGQPATVGYAFDAASNWSPAEQASFQGAMALWSSIANITFKPVDQGSAQLVFQRYQAGVSSYEGTQTDHYPTTTAIGSTVLPASVNGQQVMHLTVDTDANAFSQIGSFDFFGGYGVASIVHEMGHVLGLGHGGPYSDAAKGQAQPYQIQFSPFDLTQWTVMSYVNSGNPLSTYHKQDPYPTQWGLLPGNYNYSATTPGMVDVIAAQRLYGASTSGGLAGNQVFGFNSTITGALRPYFDFTPSADGSTNDRPIVTLFSTGTNNTLDLSGFAAASTVDLRPGTFSSADGLTNNIGIAVGTAIDKAVGGSGNDSFTLNGDGDTIDGGGGANTVNVGRQLGSVGHAWRGGQLLLSEAGGTDKLSNVQTLGFTDGSVALGGDPLVDDIYYAQHNADVFKAGVGAGAHYQQYGWHEGRNPNALFSTSAYLAANPDVAASGMDPLTHYDQFGWKEGRDPSVAFSSSLYLLRNPDVAASGMDPLTHYLEYGYMEGRQAVPVVDASKLTADFDAGYYLLANPDVAASGMDPLLHWQTYGAAEGRNPDAFFNTSEYLTQNPDVAAAGVNPLTHYLQFGWKEGRNPSDLFNTNAYLSHNKDVAAAVAAGQTDPLTHFLTYGIEEGRSGYGTSV